MSPDNSHANSVICIEDEDEMDTIPNIPESTTLLNMFRHPKVPQTMPTAHTSQEKIPAAPGIAPKLGHPDLLLSPYDSQKGPRFHSGLESSSSPLPPKFGHTFQVPPTASATTDASAALHKVVSAKKVECLTVSKKRKFTIITAADREAAMNESM